LAFRPRGIPICDWTATVCQGCGIEAGRLQYSEPGAAGLSQTEYYTDRRNANHRSRHRQKDLHGCADALASALPHIEVTGNPRAKRAANVACSIGLKDSPDEMQHRWNGNDHENERTDDYKVQFK
jgi:hypothetical protein